MTITDGKSKKGGRAKKLLATTSIAALTATTAVVPALAATPPVAPNNIVIFPNRDFLAIEGYQNRVGQEMRITATRNGVVSSRATGTIAAGDPALEVNHPGGVCWTGVTPNIKPGDVVTVRADDNPATPGDGFWKSGPTQLTVTGTLGADVNKANMEQRIVAPDLNETDIGRRDIRAPERPGPYTSSLTFPTPTTFKAVYNFNVDANTTAAEATEMRDIAAAGQMRVLTWMRTTGADGNRQGLTIAEYGEVGGPGMGGCPAGPEATAPGAPRGVTAAAGDASVTANWNASRVIPDGSPITGYKVIAINTATNVESSITVPRTARTGTVTGLQNGQDYTVEVRAASAAGLSEPGSATGAVTPQVVKPNAPVIGTASSGSTLDTAISATVTWTDSPQPAGVAIDGYRVTAFNVNADGALGSKIKSAFVDAPSTQREVLFTSAPAGQVAFKVQTIEADGNFSAQSVASNPVTAQ